MDYFHVLIEGPYSRPHSGRHFENLVMLSTGTGIPGPYYTALDLIRKTTTQPNILNSIGLFVM